MKKWLVLILLLITAAGTFVPCCGIDDCCADQAIAANHNNHENEGICSPFFACATCSASVELTKTIQLDFPSAESLVHQHAIMKSDLPSYSSSFWQPPRSC
jgi:hypothetical protein